MKKYLLIRLMLITGLIVSLSGCSKAKTIKPITQPANYYNRLSTAERKNIKFDFQARAIIDSTSNLAQNRPKINLDLIIKNKGHFPVKFELSEFNLLNLNYNPALEKTITISPGHKRTIKDIFTNIPSFNLGEGIALGYFAGKYEIAQIHQIKNQLDLDNWVIRQSERFTSHQNEFTDAQLIAWTSNALAKKDGEKNVRKYYFYRLVDFRDKRLIIVQDRNKFSQQHGSKTMAKDAPIVYQLFVNDDRQLEDLITHAIISVEYPG